MVHMLFKLLVYVQPLEIDFIHIRTFLDLFQDLTDFFFLKGGKKVWRVWYICDNVSWYFFFFFGSSLDFEVPICGSGNIPFCPAQSFHLFWADKPFLTVRVLETFQWASSEMFSFNSWFDIQTDWRGAIKVKFQWRATGQSTEDDLCVSGPDAVVDTA